MANPLGSTPGIIVGVGVGAAASAALEPAIELPKQNAWARNPNRILATSTLAALVAQGGVLLGDAEAEAARDGYAADKLRALVYLAQTVPGWAQALYAWRRGQLSDALWTHTLVKAGVDARYYPALNALKDERLSPQDLAYAVVRGLVPDAGLLPVAPPTSGGTVPRFPVANIDTLAEAAAHGFDAERFRVLVGRSGLSMAPVMAAQAFYRGEIDRDDFYLAIAEGDLRNEWRDAILAVSRQIPTADAFVENHLRGWSDAAAMYAGAALHGMSKAHADVLFTNMGRPVTVHQVTTGLARGATFPSTYADVPDGPYRRAIQESNIRPEWASIDYHNRYGYPSGFQIKSEAPEIGYDATNQLLLEVGWAPKWADFFASKWAGATSGAKADTHVSKAQTQLWNTAHTSYRAYEVSAPTATEALTTAGVAAAAIPQVLAVWDAERALMRARLSASDIRKAWQKDAINPATGAPWTKDEALAELLQLGYSTTDATAYLNIPSGGG
jgi:hypothetical protein